MTDQKYKTGEKVLVEAFIRYEANQIEPYNEPMFKLEIQNRGRHSLTDWVHLKNIRPYTPKPEFEYGEIVEAKKHGDWKPFIFVGEIKNGLNPFIVVQDNITNETLFKNGKKFDWYFMDHCRKLQPKKELIEIGGKKYDAEKVKERLADLKAEE